MEITATHTKVIDIQAGRRRRGSEDAPDRYKIEDVEYARMPFVASRRITTAGGV